MRGDDARHSWRTSCRAASTSHTGPREPRGVWWCLDGVGKGACRRGTGGDAVCGHLHVLQHPHATAGSTAKGQHTTGPGQEPGVDVTGCSLHHLLSRKVPAGVRRVVSGGGPAPSVEQSGKETMPWRTHIIRGAVHQSTSFVVRAHPKPTRSGKVSTRRRPPVLRSSSCSCQAAPAPSLPTATPRDKATGGWGEWCMCVCVGGGA